MINRIPDYLRLHSDGEEVQDENDFPLGAIAPEQQAYSMDALCQKFAEVTGVDLQYGTRDALPRELDWFMEIESSRPGESVAFAISNGKMAGKSQELEQIESLAGELGWLTDRLHKTERALWEREAELAVGVPVTAYPEIEKTHIAERLEAILRCGVEAVSCDATALYLLDDATTQLKLRSQWGFDKGVLTEPCTCTTRSSGRFGSAYGSCSGR